MAEIARRASSRTTPALCRPRRKLRAVYYKTFYDPATGVLAGWKSSDGQLHDYYFTFVNGMAITYGLVPRDQANAIMDRLLAKMKEVGFTHFEYGLPGNLIPVRRDDYLDLAKSGWPEKRMAPTAFRFTRTGPPPELCLLHAPGPIPVGPPPGGRRHPVPYAERLKREVFRVAPRMAAPTIGRHGMESRTATKACWWTATWHCLPSYRADRWDSTGPRPRVGYDRFAGNCSSWGGRCGQGGQPVVIGPPFQPSEEAPQSHGTNRPDPCPAPDK